MAVVAVVVDLRPPSRSLGCCSYHAWQAEDWVAGRYHHREESLALEVPPVALAHWADLAEAVDRFRQGLEASALARHREESLALEVPPLALVHWADLAEAVDRFRQGLQASALARHRGES